MDLIHNLDTFLFVMSATLDISIDTGASEAIEGGSIIQGQLPILTKSDSYTLRLRLLEKNQFGSYQDIDFSGASLKVGIGDIETRPSDGSFILYANGTTSTAIPFNASPLQVYNAISNNVSTVLQYGTLTYGSYLLTASQPNTAMSFGSDNYTLFPSSSILINNRRVPTANVNAQQTIRIFKNPAVYSDSFIATPTAGQATLTKIQDGGSGVNETYSLVFTELVQGGLFSLSFGPHSTIGISPQINVASFQEFLQAVTGIGVDNISVLQQASGEYSIQFCGALAQTNITTSLILDPAGLNFIPFRQTTLTLATSELEDLFAEAGTSEIEPTLEIEITQNGTPKTILQEPITIRTGLITGNPAQITPQAQYYTKAESDALFVEDSTGNVDAANRKLKDSSSVLSTDYGLRKLHDSLGAETLRWDSGIGFFGSSAITKPSGQNVVSSLTNLGLINYTQVSSANIVSAFVQTGLLQTTTTIGIFPGSIETIYGSVAVAFGTIGGHDQVSTTVAVSGASVGDMVILGLPNAVCVGLTFAAYVSETNVVRIDALNTDNASIVQSNQTYKFYVVGY